MSTSPFHLHVLTPGRSLGDLSGPTPFRFRNRFALLRLSDMKNFEAHAFSSIFRELRSAPAIRRNEYNEGECMEQVKGLIDHLVGTCQDFDLPTSFRRFSI